MRQHEPTSRERRRIRRRPAAEALWLAPEDAGERTSAWMLDISEGGASVLVPADQVPPVGARVGLEQMICRDRIVRERAMELPATARVFRHDDVHGHTRRIALRFDVPLTARLRYHPPLTNKATANPPLRTPYSRGGIGHDELTRRSETPV